MHTKIMKCRSCKLTSGMYLLLGLLKLVMLQEACDTEQELQRRVEATERQMAALQQQLNSIRKDPASQADTAEGATINLQVFSHATAFALYAFHGIMSLRLRLTNTGARAVWTSGRAEQGTRCTECFAGIKIQ